MGHWGLLDRWDLLDLQVSQATLDRQDPRVLVALLEQMVSQVLLVQLDHKDNLVIEELRVRMDLLDQVANQDW